MGSGLGLAAMRGDHEPWLRSSERGRSSSRGFNHALTSVATRFMGSHLFLWKCAAAGHSLPLRFVSAKPRIKDPLRQPRPVVPRSFWTPAEAGHNRGR